jgi:hypothetical protein
VDEHYDISNLIEILLRDITSISTVKVIIITALIRASIQQLVQNIEKTKYILISEVFSIISGNTKRQVEEINLRYIKNYRKHSGLKSIDCNTFIIYTIIKI